MSDETLGVVRGAIAAVAGFALLALSYRRFRTYRGAAKAIPVLAVALLAAEIVMGGAVVILFFSASSSKLPFYILPALPPLAWLVALASPERFETIAGSLSAYGLPLGDAFQMRDDVMGAFKKIGRIGGLSDDQVEACLNDQDAAKALVEAATFRVEEVETKPTRRNPYPPFTTSTLQQEASRKLGFDVGWYPHEDGAPLSFTPNGEIGAKVQ